VARLYKVFEIIWIRKYEETFQFFTVSELWHFGIFCLDFYVYVCVGAFGAFLHTAFVMEMLELH
jgi:hypothetical protein